MKNNLYEIDPGWEVEELPEKEGHYLATMRFLLGGKLSKPDTFLIYWDGRTWLRDEDKKGVKNGGWFFDFIVEAWAPLPEPYTEGGAENYDRNQYEKGYEQGRKDEAEKQQIECADCIRQITASDEERIRKDEREKTIDEFTQRIIDEIQIRQYDREFCKEHHIEVSICTIIAIVAIKEIAEQMKEGAKSE